jgi:DNA-binding transcriptional MerR regulator
MSKQRPIPQRRKLKCRDLCARYDVSAKTIDRWQATGVLPKPMYINGTRYWDEQAVDAADETRMAKQNAA